MSEPLDLDQLARSLAHRDDRGLALQGNLRRAQAFDPDAYARAIRTAASTGVMPQAVLRDPKAFQDAATLQQIDPTTFVNMSPRVSQWLAEHEDNAAVAHDDVSALSRIEQSGAAGTMRATTRAERFRNAIDPAVRTLQSYPITRAALGLVGGTAGMAGSIGSFFGWHGDGPTGRNALQRFQGSLDPAVTGAETVMQSDHLPFDSLAQNLGPLVPATLLSGGTALAARALGWSDRVAKVLAGTSVGAAFTAQQGGEAYTNMLEAGYSPNAARGASNTVALVNAPANALFGLTPLSRLATRNPFATSLLLGGAQGASGQVASNLLTDRPAGEGIGMAALHGAAFQGGLHMGLEWMGDYGNIVAAARESKLRARSPEKFRSAADRALEGSPVEQTRIPVEQFETYFQSRKMDPEQVAQALGAGQSFQEARAAGGDVVMKTADFLANLDPAHVDALLPDVRVQEGQLTPRQAEALRVAAPELQRIAMEEEAQAKGSPDRAAMKQELTRRYMDAGETQVVADAYATLSTNALANLARQEGLHMEEAFRLFAPNVVHGEAPVVAPELEPYRALWQSGKMDFGSKAWQEYYGLTRGGRALGDQAKRARAELKRAGTKRGQTEYDAARNAELQAEEEAFRAFEASMNQVVMGKPGDMAAQGAEATPRGWFRRRPDGTLEIGKTRMGDLSTFVHEGAHAHFWTMFELAKREMASEQIKADVRDLRIWVGAKEGEVLTTDQQEMLARGVEAYMREGKAPSTSLRQVFRRFAIWLGSVYRKVQQLGVELTPEIRNVFDRLYAAEEGVNAAHEDLAPQLFKAPEEAGWTPEQFQAYAKAKGMELETARAEILAKLEEVQMRERTDAWREEERTVREAVAAQVDADPVHQAIATFRKGGDLTLSREALVKQFGEERTKALHDRHHNVYRREGGVDAETAAELLGFNSGEELLRAMEQAPGRQVAIEQGTRAEMVRRHGDLRVDGTMEDAATLAVSNEQRARNLMTEIQAAARMAERSNTPAAELKAAAKEAKAQSQEDARKETLRALRDGSRDMTTLANGLLRENAKLKERGAKLEGQVQGLKDQAAQDAAQARQEAQDRKAGLRFAFRNMDQQSYRDSARQMVADKPIWQLEPQTYLRGQRTAYREALDALRAGDYWGVVEAKGKELLNHHLYLEAVKARGEAEGAYRYTQKFSRGTIIAKISKAGGELGEHAFMDQINAILEQYQFTRTSNKAIAASLEAWVRDHQEDGAAFDPAAMPRPRNFRELSLNELRAVTDALKNIEAVARQELGYIRDGRRVTFEGEINRFVETTRASLKVREVPRQGATLTTGEKIAARARGAAAQLDKIEWLVDRMDGGDINGPARANIKRPIDDANGRFMEMSHKVFQKLKALEEARPTEDIRDLMEPTGVQFPKMDRPMNRMQLLSWALNLGNEENRKVALLGEGLVNEDLSIRPEFDQALRELRPSEARWIQGVWDVLEGMKGDVREHALRTTGIEPEWKTITPFDITTSTGEVVHMRGGYLPLFAERLDSVGLRQANPAQLEAVAMNRPKVNGSFLQKVTGATYRLLLDYPTLLSQHLVDVLRRTTMQEALDQVHRFTTAPDVVRTMQETIGPEAAAQIHPWLMDVAGMRKGATEKNFLLDFMMSRRTGMVLARLGGNLVSNLMQVGDVFKYVADPSLDSRYLAKAFLDIRSNPREMIEMVRELSPNEMRYRDENFQREIREMWDPAKNLFDKGKGASATWIMQTFGVMDRITSFPAWLARFRQGMDQHGNQAQAVMEADRLVSRAGQAGEARNQSALMRQEGWMKLFTTFQGDANTWFGIVHNAVRGGDPKRISIVLTALVAEQVLSQIIRNRLPKEDDNKAAWASEQVLLAGTSKVPLFGDVVQYGMDRAKGKPADLNNPTSQAVAKAAEAPFRAYGYASKDEWEKAAMEGFEAVGLWTGVPGTSQLIRSWRYLHKVRTGEERPSGPGDLALHTVTGSQPKKP